MHIHPHPSGTMDLSFKPSQPYFSLIHIGNVGFDIDDRCALDHVIIQDMNDVFLHRHNSKGAQSNRVRTMRAPGREYSAFGVIHRGMGSEAGCGGTVKMEYDIDMRKSLDILKARGKLREYFECALLILGIREWSGRFILGLEGRMDDPDGME